MDFNKIYKVVNDRSIKNDTDILKNRDYEDTSTKNERIYRLSNQDGQSIKKFSKPIFTRH